MRSTRYGRERALLAYRNSWAYQDLWVGRGVPAYTKYTARGAFSELLFPLDTKDKSPGICSECFLAVFFVSGTKIRRVLSEPPWFCFAASLPRYERARYCRIEILGAIMIFASDGGGTGVYNVYRQGIFLRTTVSDRY